MNVCEFKATVIAEGYKYSWNLDDDEMARLAYAASMGYPKFTVTLRDYLGYFKYPEVIPVTVRVEWTDDEKAS